MAKVQSIAKASHKKLTGNVALKGGVSTVDQVRVMVKELAENKVEKARWVVEEADRKAVLAGKEGCKTSRT